MHQNLHLHSFLGTALIGSKPFLYQRSKLKKLKLKCSISPPRFLGIQISLFL